MMMFSLRATNRAILPVLWRDPFVGRKQRQTLRRSAVMLLKPAPCAHAATATSLSPAVLFGFAVAAHLIPRWCDSATDVWTSPSPPLPTRLTFAI